ncbi:MAG: septum formation initiator family protein, partial [Actinomycetota bacterium]|nr:septum formation initiator family protein [Actinomycetota bacterium]
VIRVGRAGAQDALPIFVAIDIASEIAVHTQQRGKNKQQTAMKSRKPAQLKAAQGVKVMQTKGQRKPSSVRVIRPKRRTRPNVGRIILLGISIAFIVWAVYPITYRMEHGRELERLEAQLAQIKTENNRLKEELKELDSDDYVEQRARRLGLSRADEEIIVVVPEKAEQSLKANPDDATKNGENKGFSSIWKRLTDWLTGAV